MKDRRGEYKNGSFGGHRKYMNRGTLSTLWEFVMIRGDLTCGRNWYAASIPPTHFRHGKEKWFLPVAPSSQIRSIRSRNRCPGTWECLMTVVNEKCHWFVHLVFYLPQVSRSRQGNTRRLNFLPIRFSSQLRSHDLTSQLCLYIWLWSRNKQRLRYGTLSFYGRQLNLVPTEYGFCRVITGCYWASAYHCGLPTASAGRVEFISTNNSNILIQSSI